MDKNGLIVEPEFHNINKYLQEGEMTRVTDSIKRISEKIDGNTEGMLLRNIVLWIHQNTVRLNSPKDERKFKRTASEILLSRERTGCCDTATLFTALARAKDIPTMQIITFSKTWGKDFEKGNSQGTEGHFFVASNIKDIKGEANWILLDPDRYVSDSREVRLEHLNTEDRNIGNNYYAFAYVNDYRDIEIDGLRIDSISDMGEIQQGAYKECNKKDFTKREEYER